MADVRITVAVARVLREFLADPGEARHGYELIQLTGFSSGKLYPLLARLHRAGLLVREREDVDPHQAGRPARYLYHLNANAIEPVRQQLAELSDQLRPAVPQHLSPPIARPHPRLEGGAA